MGSDGADADTLREDTCRAARHDGRDGRTRRLGNRHGSRLRVCRGVDVRRLTARWTRARGAGVVEDCGGYLGRTVGGVGDG